MSSSATVLETKERGDKGDSHSTVFIHPNKATQVTSRKHTHSKGVWRTIPDKGPQNRTLFKYTNTRRGDDETHLEINELIMTLNEDRKQEVPNKGIREHKGNKTQQYVIQWISLILLFLTVNTLNLTITALYFSVVLLKTTLCTLYLRIY